MVNPLLSSKLRNIGLSDIESLNDKQVFTLFKAIRWGNSQNIHAVICPHCGSYFNQKRHCWTCKYPDCKRDFYLTTHTAFSHHKLSYKQILRAIFLYICHAKGRPLTHSQYSVQNCLCLTRQGSRSVI